MMIERKTKDESQGNTFGSRPSSLVSLRIYNIQGQEVRTLVNDAKEPGSYTVTWSGEDNSGEIVASGIYFYRLEVGASRETKKMIYLH